MKMKLLIVGILTSANLSAFADVACKELDRTQLKARVENDIKSYFKSLNYGWDVSGNGVYTDFRVSKVELGSLSVKSTTLMAYPVKLSLISDHRESLSVYGSIVYDISNCEISDFYASPTDKTFKL